MHVRMIDVTIVADDLTGAGDTGALFAGQGPVSVVVAPNLPDVDLEVVTLDTETRALSDDDAAAAMRRVGAALAPRLARSALFKKIDSTFRGPVAVELDALVEGARARAAPPPQGGTRRRRGSRAGRTRAPRPRRGRRGNGCGFERPRPRDSRSIRSRPGRLAGLAQAAAVAWGRAGSAPALPDAGSRLVVAGSRHPATREQIAAVERGGLTGVRVKRGGSVDIHRVVDRLREGAGAFIASSDAFDGPRDEVATRLAAVASAVLAEVSPALLVLTGGDTALAVLRALSARRLELDGAPATGLALGRLVRDGRPALTVLTKAGGFGAPDLLASLVKGAVR